MMQWSEEIKRFTKDGTLKVLVYACAAQMHEPFASATFCSGFDGFRMTDAHTPHAVHGGIPRITDMPIMGVARTLRRNVRTTYRHVRLGLQIPCRAERRDGRSTQPVRRGAHDLPCRRGRVPLDHQCFQGRDE